MSLVRCSWCDTGGYSNIAVHESACPLNPAADTETCRDCDGYGSDNAGEDCPVCNATGAVRR